MEIIEAISDTNVGGAGVLLVTRLLADGEMRKKTLVVLPCGSALRDRLGQIGVATVEIDACADSSFQLSAIPKYIRLIKCVRPHTVNCHGCLSFRIAAYLCGVPVRIYTRHCTFPQKPWQRLSVLRLAVGVVQSSLSNGIIAVAQAARDDLVAMGVPQGKIRVIINGVTGIERLDGTERAGIRKRLSIPKNATVIGIFARLEEYKGHEDLIRAAKILLSSSEAYRFLVVGGGSLENKLKNLCRKMWVYEKFIFTGFVPDVTEFMNITDVNINCSHGTETSSLALSEGMSIGIPAVASDYGGNPYMVRDGENGFIYPAGDAKALADCIEKIVTNDGLRARLSKNARKRFETELNAKKMTEATYNYYTELRRISRGVQKESLQNN